jgi:hypothetical protein
LDAFPLGSEDSEAEAHTPIADLRSSGEEGKGSSSSLPGALRNSSSSSSSPLPIHADLNAGNLWWRVAGGGWPLVSVNAQCG